MLPTTAELLDLGQVRLFRYLPLHAPYPADAPFAGGHGRFDAGQATLYLADTAEGAVAEFYRQHPEFLASQGTVERFDLFEVELIVSGPVLDVRTPSQARAAGIAFDRLTSSDAEPVARYRECRDLAQRCGQSTTGIVYPSAALQSGSWNLVVFDEPIPQRWSACTTLPVPTPFVDATAVVAVQQRIPETRRGGRREAR